MLPSTLHASAQILASAIHAILISECTPLTLRRWLLAQIREIGKALPFERRREVEAAEAEAIIIAAAYLTEEQFNDARLLLSEQLLQADDGAQLPAPPAAASPTQPAVQRTGQARRRRTRYRTSSRSHDQDG